MGVAYENIGLVPLVGIERRHGGDVHEMVVAGQHDAGKVLHRDPVRAPLEPGGVGNGELPAL